MEEMEDFHTYTMEGKAAFVSWASKYGAPGTSRLESWRVVAIPGKDVTMSTAVTVTILVLTDSRFENKVTSNMVSL